MLELRLAAMAHFCHLELRTTDVAAARDFYERVLGPGPREIVPLPAEAAARGARPHWLGHLGVADVEGTTAAFVSRGATRLGPTRATAAGPVQLVRDPGGAVLALAAAADAAPAGAVWRVLLTPDVPAALDTYCALFGWEIVRPVDLGALGVYHQFAFAPGAAAVGSIGGTVGRPGVHPQWMFHFGVADLDAACAAARAAGGLVLDPMTLPSGDRVAACDDAQGAAFALHQRAQIA